MLNKFFFNILNNITEFVKRSFDILFDISIMSILNKYHLKYPNQRRLPWKKHAVTLRQISHKCTFTEEHRTAIRNL